MEMYIVWIWICDPCLNFTFVYFQPKLMNVRLQFREQLQVKSQRKSKRIAAYDWYEFLLSGMHKLVNVRNRCRNVWIMLLSYTYIIVSRSFLFSGFNRILYCLQLSTDVDWIKCCAFKQFHFRVPLPLGGPWRQAERGMALAAIKEFWWAGSWE